MKKYNEYITECLNESNKKSDDKFDKKYYDVKFNKETIIKNVYVGENKYISVLAKQNDILRIYIDKQNTNNNQLAIKAIAPISDKEPIFTSSNKKTININNLWSANFIVENNIFNTKILPFTFI